MAPVFLFPRAWSCDICHHSPRHTRESGERTGTEVGPHFILFFVKILTATINALITPVQLLEPEFQEYLGFSRQDCLENC